jgi:predicted methyltransferase
MNLSQGGSIADWRKLFRQCMDNLKPGGWVEVMDFEGKPVSML